MVRARRIRDWCNRQKEHGTNKVHHEICWFEIPEMISRFQAYYACLSKTILVLWLLTVGCYWVNESSSSDEVADKFQGCFFGIIEGEELKVCWNVEGKPEWCCLWKEKNVPNLNSSTISLDHPFRNCTRRFLNWHKNKTKKLIMNSKCNRIVRSCHTMDTGNLEQSFREKNNYLMDNERLPVLIPTKVRSMKKMLLRMLWWNWRNHTMLNSWSWHGQCPINTFIEVWTTFGLWTGI